MPELKIDKNHTINLYQMGFEYAKDRHSQLLTKISDIRNVANYIITGVIAFTGFILTSNFSKTILESPTQKIFFFSTLVLIIAFWLKLNWSIKVQVGFNPYDLARTIKEINTSDFNEIKRKADIMAEDPEIGIYELILQTKTNEYIKAEKLLSGEIENLRKLLIVFSILFFSICTLFILFPNFNITF